MMNAFSNIYLIGAGGIGMSALARWFKANGYLVAGYDKTASGLTDEMQKEGIHIHFVNDVKQIPEEFKNKEKTLVIYTPAVAVDHSELTWFRDKGFVIKKRAEVLGMLTKSFFTIAVAGTHGKTTTSSMIAHILKESGKNVFAFIGGVTRNYQSNLLIGNSGEDERIMVVEADEFDRSFLCLQPDIAIITSMDSDHLDIYDNEEEVIKAFNEFAAKTDINGVLIYKNGLPAATEGKKMSFGIEEGDFRARNIRVEQCVFRFDLGGEEEMNNLEIQMPGRHNILNALAAYMTARRVGITPKSAKKALSSYKGVNRRFEWHINRENFKYIDDYAHHPEEIKATLRTARELFGDKKITVIFQPHLFSRTKDFMAEFAESLEFADEVILLPIYPARESPIEGINSQTLLNRVRVANKALWEKEDFAECLKSLRTDVLITLGAGDIDRLVEPVKKFFAHEEVV